MMCVITDSSWGPGLCRCHQELRLDFINMNKCTSKSHKNTKLFLGLLSHCFYVAECCHHVVNKREFQTDINTKPNKKYCHLWVRALLCSQIRFMARNSKLKKLEQRIDSIRQYTTYSCWVSSYMKLMIFFWHNLPCYSFIPIK